jgi:hypothetical protein
MLKAFGYVPIEYSLEMGKQREEKVMLRRF